MKRLWVYFGVRLSLVLLLATILPVFLLYFLSESGFIEAYYQVGTESDGRIRFELLNDADIGNRDASLPDERLSYNEIGSSDGDNLDTGSSRLPFEYIPESNVWRVASESSKVVVSVPSFHFLVELPAKIAIIALPLISLAFAIILSVWMSRSITRPFSTLAEAAEQISNHNLTHRIQPAGSKEFQDLARSINLMAERLEKLEESRRDLMADMAHELRTPLTVLSGNLRAILDGVHEMSEEEIAILFEQTNHLSRLVNDLRDLSLAESNQLSMNFTEVDLALLIKETVAHYDHMAEEQGLEISTDLETPLIHPRIDQNRIRQVLHNLISNSFRYTPRGGKVTISARRNAEDRSIQIDVTDTGIGISEEELPFLFIRFQKFRDSSEVGTGGTGLGLAIVKAILELHGGKIYAASGGMNQGCTFTIILPEIVE